MSNPFECRSPLSSSVSLQLDLDDTLAEDPREGVINTDGSLLAEITRLREENRALKEEIRRLRSVQMVSVATQTEPDELRSPTLLMPQQRLLSPPMQPLKRSPTLSLMPPPTTLPSLEERSKAQSLSIVKENENENENENEKEVVDDEEDLVKKKDEEVENEKKDNENDGNNNNNSTNNNTNNNNDNNDNNDNDKENIPVTFNTPPKYSKDCPCK